MLDRFNRKIDYLRISITDRCNLRCTYCMPEQGVVLKKHHDIISYELISAIVREAVTLGIQKVRLTGGEPLVRKDVISLIRYESRNNKIVSFILFRYGKTTAIYGRINNHRISAVSMFDSIPDIPADSDKVCHSRGAPSIPGLEISKHILSEPFLKTAELT